jgi:ketosteroid isomerase-like protein
MTSSGERSERFPAWRALITARKRWNEWMAVIRSALENFEVTLADVLRDEDDVTLIAELLRGRGRESGVEVEMTIYSAYWFEDGKIVRRLAFTERDEALAAAGLSD